MLDEKTRLLVIQSLVLSRLDYCSLVWGDIPQCLQKELQKCMNFCSQGCLQRQFQEKRPCIPSPKETWLDPYT